MNIECIVYNVVFNRIWRVENIKYCCSVYKKYIRQWSIGLIGIFVVDINAIIYKIVNVEANMVKVDMEGITKVMK